MTTHLRGLDCAFGIVPGHERNFARAIKAQGFGFVVRYLSPDPAKNLSAAEVHAYRAEGIDIVTVYESTGTTALGGTVAGRQDAQAAKAQLKTLGAPEHAPVYFAVDFPIDPSQMAALNAYLDACAYQLSEDLTGVYGGLEATQAQHCHYKWGTYAWSNGQWNPGDQLRQILNSAGTIQGVSYDADTAEGADFGQWQWPAPSHRAPAKPKRKPVRTVAKKTGTAVRTTVRKEPVVSAAGAAGALSAAVALLAKHVGWNLTPTELSSILTALPGLATIFAAIKARPVNLSLIIGTLGTLGTAAAAFGLHEPASLIGGSAPFLTALLGLVVRSQVTPAISLAPVTVPITPVPADPPAAPAPVTVPLQELLR